MTRSVAGTSFPSAILEFRIQVPAKRAGSLVFVTSDGSVAHAPITNGITKQAINGLRNDVVLDSCISPVRFSRGCEETRRYNLPLIASLI